MSAKMAHPRETLREREDNRHAKVKTSLLLIRIESQLPACIKVGKIAKQSVRLRLI